MESDVGAALTASGAPTKIAAAMPPAARSASRRDETAVLVSSRMLSDSNDGLTETAADRKAPPLPGAPGAKPCATSNRTAHANTSAPIGPFGVRRTMRDPLGVAENILELKTSLNKKIF